MICIGMGIFPDYQQRSKKPKYAVARVSAAVWPIALPTPLGHTLAAPFGVRVVILPAAGRMSFAPFDVRVVDSAGCNSHVLGVNPNPLARERKKKSFSLLICI
jgi:hypothetical protein